MWLLFLFLASAPATPHVYSEQGSANAPTLFATQAACLKKAAEAERDIKASGDVPPFTLKCIKQEDTQK